MYEHITLRVNMDNSWERLINNDTGEVLVEGPRLRAEDVLWGLGYKFGIEIDPNEAMPETTGYISEMEEENNG